VKFGESVLMRNWLSFYVIMHFAVSQSRHYIRQCRMMYIGTRT